MIERNGPITRHMERFHSSIEKTLRGELGRADLADLGGELIPGGKEQVPLQAADLFCWYVRNASGLNPRDRRRLHSMTDRPGYATRASEKEVDEFAERAALTHDSEDYADFEGVRGSTKSP